MVVNFEFLGMESVENVITCMHYKVDKVVYCFFQGATRPQTSSNRF